MILFKAMMTNARNMSSPQASKGTPGEEKKIRIEDGTTVKVKTAPSHEGIRPEYHCETCNISFPSELDLEEHRKVDHAKKKANTEA